MCVERSTFPFHGRTPEYTTLQLQHLSGMGSERSLSTSSSSSGLGTADPNSPDGRTQIETLAYSLTQLSTHKCTSPHWFSGRLRYVDIIVEKNG